MIARAVSKFHWAYRQGTQRMENFVTLWRQSDFFAQPEN
jgi:hypothetical protein